MGAIKWAIAHILILLAIPPAHIPGEDPPKYPTDFFILPVNREIKLSGTFGELRSNHFHAGIDIKSANGTTGEPLHAAGDGYVSRIKVQAFSYGRALYIDHPNGYTTVYAHLDAFNDELEAYIRKKQYQHQRFDVDLYPDPDAFPLKQGDFIGKLGNSGYSFGPHLHFEIRKTATQVPVNPMLFNLPIRDDVPPVMQQLVVYHLNEKQEVLREKVYPVKRNHDGSYAIPRALEEPAWRVAFGLKAYDQMDGTYNRNGIYALEMDVDGRPVYGFRMDEIPFHLTRYLNAHIDYRLKKRGQGNINRLYQLPGNRLDIYLPRKEDGIVELYENQPREIAITVSDAEGNSSRLTFQARRDTDIPAPGQPVFHFTVPYNQPFEMRQDGITIKMEAGTFYEDAYLQYGYDGKPGQDEAATYSIGDGGIPVHKYFDISIDASGLKSPDRQRAFVAHIDDRGRVYNLGGRWDGNILHARSRSLGQFTIRTDEEAPLIRPLSFGQKMTGWKSMSFLIRDELRTGGDADDLKFDATVDGDWILMEYDGKNDKITHRFDGKIPPGEHTLRIRVLDDRGNESVLEESFIL